MEGTNKHEHEFSKQELRGDSLETLFRINSEKMRLVEKLTTQAEIFTERFPFLKNKIEEALGRASVSLRLIAGAGVLAVASQGAFAQEISEAEYSKIDTPSTATEIIKADTGGVEEKADPSAEFSKNITEICINAEDASTCASALINAIVVEKNKTIINSLSDFRNAKDLASKKVAFDKLLHQIPIFGDKLIERTKDGLPILQTLTFIPNGDGSLSVSAEKLIEHVNVISDASGKISDRVEAGIKIVDESPLRMLPKINPLTNVIKGIHTISQELSKPKPDVYKILSAVGKIALNKITFGLGGFLGDAAKNVINAVKTTNSTTNSKDVPVSENTTKELKDL